MSLVARESETQNEIQLQLQEWKWTRSFLVSFSFSLQKQVFYVAKKSLRAFHEGRQIALSLSNTDRVDSTLLFNVTKPKKDDKREEQGTQLLAQMLEERKQEQIQRQHLLKARDDAIQKRRIKRSWPEVKTFRITKIRVRTKNPLVHDPTKLCAFKEVKKRKCLSNPSRSFECLSNPSRSFGCSENRFYLLKSKDGNLQIWVSLSTKVRLDPSTRLRYETILSTCNIIHEKSQRQGLKRLLTTCQDNVYELCSFGDERPWGVLRFSPDKKTKYVILDHLSKHKTLSSNVKQIKAFQSL